MSGPERAPRAPALQVLAGRPDDAELAALVAVLLRRPRPVAPAPAPAPSGWNRPPAWQHPLPAPGPGAWAAAARLPGRRTRPGW